MMLIASHKCRTPFDYDTYEGTFHRTPVKGHYG